MATTLVRSLCVLTIASLAVFNNNSLTCKINENTVKNTIKYHLLNAHMHTIIHYLNDSVISCAQCIKQSLASMQTLEMTQFNFAAA